MNRLHTWYCRTDHWARAIEHDLLGPTLGQVDLGDDLLELGAGTGTVTRHLRRRAARVTAVDIDGDSLGRLRVRLGIDRSAPAASAGRIHPVRADAAALPFGAGAFSGVAAFTMLHHVPGIESQRQLAREARRVLSPGGAFVGCDAVWTLGLRLFHLGDTFAPVRPDRWTKELTAAGFDDVKVSAAGRYLYWRARAG